MGTLLRVAPATSFSGCFQIPPSKPETQRAILASALAAGRSRIRGALRCDEIETMKRACQAIGAKITERPDGLDIDGVGGAPRFRDRTIDAAGSALVFRTMTALAAVQPLPIVLTGDATLRRRVMSPLFDALRELGADIQSTGDWGSAPVIASGRAVQNDRCQLAGNVSSQFITAMLFALPLTDRPVHIEVTDEVYSKSYIRQTLATLTAAGVAVDASPDCRHFRVEPSIYRPQDVYIKEDYTSASYLLAAAALYKGRSVFRNVHGESTQGEAAIISILQQLGLKIDIDRRSNTLILENRDGMLRGGFEIDVRDCPNIAPTLAALGAYVTGTLRVVGARLTRLHKASRVEAMVSELSSAGVDIEVVRRDGVCDGFQVRGAPSYPGGCTFSSWGDHRIFMSLFVASLRMHRPSFCSGFEDVRLSFPDFVQEFATGGVKTTIVQNEDDVQGAARGRSHDDTTRDLITRRRYIPNARVEERNG
jgi:3-phosphoshikimate 1-carboxyvinyltransferase